VSVCVYVCAWATLPDLNKMNEWIAILFLYLCIRFSLLRSSPHKRHVSIVGLFVWLSGRFITNVVKTSQFIKLCSGLRVI